MKVKGLFLVALSATVISANAQKGVDNGTKYGSGEDSVRCLTNISLATSYAKVGNFQDAYPFWKIAYDECPASTKNLYLYGTQILDWQISQEKDPAKLATLIDDLMALYDKRVKYFGDDPQNGKDWIIARKAQEYLTRKGDDVDATKPYEWLREVIDEYKEKVDPMAVSLYMFVSNKVMTQDENHKSKFVEDFLTCSKLLDEKLKAAENDEKTLGSLQTMKTEIENRFANSGAADCATLESIYKDKIEQNKEDIKFLKETLVLLRRVGCQESEIYFAASEYAHRIEPTAESALGMGKQALKKDDSAMAEKYFIEAAEMAEEADIKGDIYYTLALIAYEQKSYSKSRDYCRKAIAANPALCSPYILIGNMYAATANSVSDDPVIRKCAFYAAVDKFEKARQVDESCASDANRLISTYRQHFPTNEEIFMHPAIEEGKAITIGGWIGESTIVRKNK